MDTAQNDTKVGTIWILAIALIVVLVLYVMELRKPDSLGDFSSSLVENRMDLKESCGDLKTDAGREKCIGALNKTQDTLETIK